MSRVEVSDVCHIFQDSYSQWKSKKKKKRHRGGESGFKFPQPSTKFQPGCDQEQKHIHVDPFQEGDKTDKTKKHRKTMVLPSGCQNSYWKWPFIVDFPIKNGDFPQLC